MANNVLSKRKLNDLLKKLPAPIVLHLKRTKKIAEFILENAKLTDWYIDLNINERRLTEAVYYHDFGKAFLNEECYYLKYCKKQEDKDEYKTHISQAKNFIEENSDKYKASTKSFDYYLYNCLYHHENYNGTGFDDCLVGEEIPFCARLCAVADYCDNLLNVGAIKSTSFQKAMKQLGDVSGTILDPEIVNVLISNSEVFENFCDDLFDSEKKARNKYGMIIKYTPIYEVNTNQIVGLDTNLSINDSYFGIVPFESVLPAIETNETIVRVNKLAELKVFSDIKQLEKKKLLFKQIRIVESVRSISKKTFIKNLMNTLKLYEISPSKICIAISEDVLLDDKSDVIFTINSLYDLGFRISIENFGNRVSSFDLFDQLRVHEIKISERLIQKSMTNDNTLDILKGLINIASNLDIDVLCPSIDNKEINSLFSLLGMNYAEGKFYHDACTLAALDKVLTKM